MRTEAMLAMPFFGFRSIGAEPGAVAQLVERLLCKEKVRSSNLLGSTARVVGYHQKSAGTQRCPPRRGGQPAKNQLPNDRAFEPVHISVPCPDSSER